MAAAIQQFLNHSPSVRPLRDVVNLIHFRMRRHSQGNPFEIPNNDDVRCVKVIPVIQWLPSGLVLTLGRLREITIYIFGESEHDL